MGNYRPGSDIDLVIISPYLSHEDHMKIFNALEDLELLYEIDCLNYTSIKEPALKEHIDNYGKILYKAWSLNLKQISNIKKKPLMR